MIKIRQKNQGLSIIEYAALMVFLIAALLTMQYYLRNAVCGRWKQSVDRLGYGRQYEPGFDDSDIPTTIN